MEKKNKLDSPDENGEQVRGVLKNLGPVTLSDKGTDN